MPTRSRSVRPVLIGGAAVLVLLLAASQFVLPLLAERRLADELERYGPRPEVEVSAFPAFKLLFGRADRVEVHADMARVQPGSLVDELSTRADVDDVEVSIGELQVGALQLADVRITKDGDDARAAATVTLQGLQLALRDLANIRVLPSDDGILIGGEVTVFGRTIGGRARVRALDGRLVVGVEGLPLGTVTLLDDDRLRVTGVGAREVPGGYRLSIDGVLTDAAG